MISFLVTLSLSLMPWTNLESDNTPKTLSKEQKVIAQKIATGHSYQKHVVDGKEFPKIQSKEEFQKEVERVIASPTDHKKLTNSREAFFDEKNNVLVIIDPNSKDRGTCFRPSRGKKYFDNLK